MVGFGPRVTGKILAARNVQEVVMETRNSCFQGTFHQEIMRKFSQPSSPMFMDRWARNFMGRWRTDDLMEIRKCSQEIIIWFLPFSKEDTRAILVYAKDICGILVFATDILWHTQYAAVEWVCLSRSRQNCIIIFIDAFYRSTGPSRPAVSSLLSVQEALDHCATARSRR